jgi:nitroreductase
MALDLTADEVLTTTRSVRKRLDLERPVSRALIEECLEIAFQAPNGSNLNLWKWVVVDDPDLIRKAAELYDQSQEDFLQLYGANYRGSDLGGQEKMTESVFHLRKTMGQVPAMVFPLMPGRADGMDVFQQASAWGSILQAVWSLFLALRVRGLGSAWTTVHLTREKQMAELLGIPMDRYTQTGLFPVAYTIGTDFKKALRRPVEDVVSWNRFGER